MRRSPAFDPARVARFTDARIASLLTNPAIVRHRQKIESTVSNAQAFRAPCSANAAASTRYVWAFVGGAPKMNRPSATARRADAGPRNPMR